MKRILTIVLTGILAFSAFSLVISDTVKADPSPPEVTGLDWAEPIAWRMCLVNPGPDDHCRDWLGILGTGFVPESEVIFRTPAGDPRPIPADRTEYQDSDRINVYVEVSAGTWTAQVVNPDGQESNQFPFDVTPPGYEASWTGAAENGWHNPLGSGTALETSNCYDFDSHGYICNWDMRHAGLDFIASHDTKVWSIAAGNVTHVGQPGTDNQHVFIRHEGSDGSFFAVYGHIDPIEGLEKGVEVTRGKVIGTVRDCTIYSDHLHFGINANDEIPDYSFGDHNWGQTLPDTNPEDLGWRDPIEYLENTQSGGDGEPVDVVLIIDSSGSMSSNDPSEERLDAAEAFLTACLPGDQVGVVDFDSTAKLLGDGLYPLPENKDTLSSLIAGIDASGTTNIRDAITVSCQELSNDGSATQRGAILLTDGNHNEGSFGNPQQCFIDNNWPIYTFGFGSADAALLQQIADETGGEYKHISDVSSLLCEFQRVRAMVAGVEPPPCIVDHIDPGEIVRRFVEVPPNQAQATFSSNWIGSDIAMNLTTPSGRVIDRDTVAPDVVHDKGADFEVYTIMDPEAGSWQVDLFGLDVPPGGEDVVFGFVSIPHGPGTGTPVADAGPDQTVYIIPPAATAMVTLDGSGSYDPDGDPLTYNWTWDGNIANGVSPTVELPLGTTTITLVVNDGQVDSEPDTVDITVNLPPTISYAPKYFLFAGTEDGENPQSRTLTIYNFGDEGCAPLAWNLTAGAEWLTLSPTSGTKMRTMPGDQVDVSVDISDMSAGRYFTWITIEAPGATNTPQQVPVFLYIRANYGPLPWL